MEEEFGAEASGKKKSGSGTIVTVAIVLLLSIGAAGGGWFFGGLLAPQLKTEEEKEPASTQALVHAPASAGGAVEAGDILLLERPNLVALDPIMTNLSYPSENWIRVEVALLFRESPDMEVADTINEDILAYLRTVTLPQIEGPRGFQYLREDLVERAQLRSEGKISDVIFRTFVIE